MFLIIRGLGTLRSVLMSVLLGGSFFFQAEDGIRDHCVTGVQTCALPILPNGTSVVAGTEVSSQANALNQDSVELTDDFTFYTGNHQITVGTHNEFFKFANLFKIGRASCRERV